MNQPGAKGRSTLFWIILAVGGSCAGCSVLSLAVLLFGVSTIDGGPPAVPTFRSHTGLPTGNTPHLYPGMPGWLPSGRGVAIPNAEVVDGAPQGLWWNFTVLSDGKTFGAATRLFLPDGTCASNPRPGGGTLFDVEGQRDQPGSTGLGTFEVSDGNITQTIDGFTSKDAFESGSDGEGPFFKMGAAKYQPLTPPDVLVGTWKSTTGKFIVRDDGTFELGNVLNNDEFVVAAGGKGMWQLDGYLLQLKQENGVSWISLVGMTGDSFLIVGTTVYTRQ